MNFFGLGTTATVDITLDDAATRSQIVEKDENGEVEQLYLFTGDEAVTGKASINLKGAKLDHLGMKIELIGQIENLYDRANPHEFMSLVKELAPAGALTESQVFPFEFTNVDKDYETYCGASVRLRYFLRVTISRNYSSNITQMLDFAVRKIEEQPDVNTSIKMEVGIEDCMHIEFEYSKNKFHLSEVVIGKVFFLLVRIKIKHMEIVIVKKESTGTGPNAYNDSKNIAKFEIMDGAPVRGESIPIRLFLKAYDLTPTYKSGHGKFSVRYMLNLVLVDEEERRYFKAQEITLWRNTLDDIIVNSAKPKDTASAKD